MTSANKGSGKKTRSIWLVDGMNVTLIGNKLPSIRQVLSYFFHLLLLQKKNTQDSGRETAREVQTFWEKARIPSPVI